MTVPFLIMLFVVDKDKNLPRKWGCSEPRRAVCVWTGPMVVSDTGHLVRNREWGTLELTAHSSCAVTFSEGPYSKNEDPGSPEGEMGQASSFQPWDFMISQIKTAT